VRRVAVLVALLCVVGIAAWGVAQAAAPRHASKPHETIQQINARKLLAMYAATGGCGCTGATRAADRTAERAARDQQIALRAHAGD
jgi:hypothetical protein